MADFADLLIGAGLLQFGWFTPDDAPYRLNLDMLPSYPEVLTAAAEQAMPFTVSISRLLATPDAIPFGVALSLRTGIPLVYSRGSEDAPVNDLVGAYDIGHVTLLVTNCIFSWEAVMNFSRRAHAVGLEVKAVVALVSICNPTAPNGKTSFAITDLDSAVVRLAERRELPRSHADAVRLWLQRC